MDAIRIQNLRSIKDSDYIKINRLNILLGQNSSGKSTFLRTFPLLKQSVKKSLRGPLLWFDSSSVDFGDYNIAKNKYVDNTESIKFAFKISAQQLKGRLTYYRPIRYYNMGFFPNLSVGNIELEISINQDNRGTFINEMTLISDDRIITIGAKSRNDILSIKINGKNFTDKVSIKWSYSLSHGIIPSIISAKNDGGIFDFQTSLIDSCITIIKNLCDKRLKDNNKILQLLMKGTDIRKDALLAYWKQQKIIPSFAKNIQMWSSETLEFVEIYNLWLLLQLPVVLDLVDDRIKSFFTNCSYIAPTRAEAMRFYRNQELEVSEVDAYGKNLQEFISSLSDKELQEFHSFTIKTLGVKVTISDSMSHQSINIERKQGESFNLADVGFGYSQILPVITKLWHATRKSRKVRQGDCKRIVCVVIEQPELHLHPAMQAIIADAFIETIESAEQNEIDLRLIIETHSPTIVNRIGRRIAEQKLSNEYVNILLFEKDSDMQNTNIRSTFFNGEGQIKNWPLGFFEP